MTRRIYCCNCTTSFIELPAEVQLSPAFKFTCKHCCGPAPNRIKGFMAHDPRLGHSGKRPGEVILPPGFQLDRKTPKPIKPGPEWCFYDAFLTELAVRVSHTPQEMAKALLLMNGRWRRQKTFLELAEDTHQSVEEARKGLSILRTKGNALWKKKQRAEAKLKRHGELSVMARELADKGFSVRRAAEIMGVSVGHASELRRAA